MKLVAQVVDIGSNKCEVTISSRQPQNKTHDESESDTDSESDNRTNNIKSTIITSRSVTNGKISSAHDDTESNSDSSSDSSSSGEKGVKRNFIVVTKAADPLKALLINGM